MNLWLYAAIALLLIPSGLHLLEAYQEARDRARFSNASAWAQFGIGLSGLLAALFIYIGANYK